MRPIDADAIYPWYVKSFSEEALGERKITPNEIKFSMNDIRENLDNIPTIELEQTRWIPVSERLPEENKTVMASTKYGVYPETHYTKEYGWEWAYEAGADYWKKLDEVAAWMPLPEPYRAESEDEENDNGKIRPRDNKTGMHT